MKVADLTIDEFRALLREALDEPQQNREGELRPAFAEELRASLAKPRRGIGTADLLRRLQPE